MVVRFAKIVNGRRKSHDLAQTVPPCLGAQSDSRQLFVAASLQYDAGGGMGVDQVLWQQRRGGDIRPIRCESRRTVRRLRSVNASRRPPTSRPDIGCTAIVSSITMKFGHELRDGREEVITVISRNLAAGQAELHVELGHVGFSFAHGSKVQASEI